MDATEVAECWQLAVQHRKTPSVLVLTRQKLPYLSNNRTEHSENMSAKGGYVLIENSQAEVTLMATGSEVSLAVDAKNMLEELGIPARVVSMPCMELFSKQSQYYKNQVLGNSLRIGIEAACEGVWSKYLGDNGIFIGMNSFGASAPAEKLYMHFGITAEIVVEKVKNILRK